MKSRLVMFMALLLAAGRGRAGRHPGRSLVPSRAAGGARLAAHDSRPPTSASSSPARRRTTIRSRSFARQQASSRTWSATTAAGRSRSRPSFAETIRSARRDPVRADRPDLRLGLGHRRRRLRQLPALVRRQRPRLRPRRRHRLRARDERALVLLGLPALVAGDVCRRLAAYRARCSACRAPRTSPGCGPSTRTSPAPARSQPGGRAASYVTWVGIDGYYYRPSDTFASVFGRTIDQVRAFTSNPVLLSETAVGPAAGQFVKISNLFAGMADYQTLGPGLVRQGPGRARQLPNAGLADRGQRAGADRLQARAVVPGAAQALSLRHSRAAAVRPELSAG